MGRLSKNVPRPISAHAWYYVNRGSVDIIAETPTTKITTHTRITRKILGEMMREVMLRPKK